jgi:hypothetical protein
VEKESNLPSVTDPLQPGEVVGFTVSLAYTVNREDGIRDVAKIRQYDRVEATDADLALALAKERLAAELQRAGCMAHADQLLIINGATNPVLCG